MTTTISTLIDSLSELRASKKGLEGQLKDIEKDISAVEGDIIKAMDAEGVLETKSTVAKVSISESVYPHVEQWEQFAEFILENRYLHLLERRPAVLAYRELLSLGKPVPGVLPFTKRKLSYKEA